MNVVEQLDALLDEHRLRPAAVLLTHGHLDHTFSVTPVCGARGITAYIHPDDQEMLADPAKGLSLDLQQLFGGRFTWTEPEDVEPLTDGKVLDLAGVRADRRPCTRPYARVGALPHPERPGRRPRAAVFQR